MKTQTITKAGSVPWGTMEVECGNDKERTPLQVSGVAHGRPHIVDVSSGVRVRTVVFGRSRDPR